MRNGIGIGRIKIKLIEYLIFLSLLSLYKMKINRYDIIYRGSVSEAGDEKREGPLKKYHVAKPFADRRYKVSSARTYFYLNEANCERNMDIFIRCLESVAGESIIKILPFFFSSRKIYSLKFLNSQRDEYIESNEYTLIIFFKIHKK